MEVDAELQSYKDLLEEEAIDEGPAELDKDDEALLDELRVVTMAGS
jgi:hypothetical protein